MIGTLFLLLIVVLLLLGIVFFFTPPKKEKSKPSQEELLWEEEKARARRESEAEQNKEWFKEGRWLTDKEIDWVCGKMEKENKMPGSFPGQETPSKFKTLPAHQFCYVREITNKKEAGADLAFKELLNQINDPNKELIFIPVNNPNFHWSLLVYETKSKGFYHWDTLRGANWRYVKDSVYKLLGELQVPRHEWDKHFIAKHKIKQNNGWECGLCVVGIMKRVREKYSGSMENIELGEFSFEKEREELKEKYLKENG